MTQSEKNQVFTWNCSNLSAKRPFSRPVSYQYQEHFNDPDWIPLKNYLVKIRAWTFQTVKYKKSVLKVYFEHRRNDLNHRYRFSIDRGNLSAHTSEFVNPIFWFHP